MLVDLLPDLRARPSRRAVDKAGGDGHERRREGAEEEPCGCQRRRWEVSGLRQDVEGKGGCVGGHREMHEQRMAGVLEWLALNDLRKCPRACLARRESKIGRASCRERV